MTTTLDLYGLTNTDLDTIIRGLQTLFAIQFEARNSLWYGDYYLCRPIKGEKEEFRLVLNYNDYLKDWLEPDFKDTPSLLYVHYSPYPDEIRQRLSLLEDCTHLRRRIT